MTLALTVSLTLTVLALMVYARKHKSRRIISTMLEAMSIPAYRNSLPLFVKEIARARRFNHPLTVAVIKPAAQPTPGNVHHLDPVLHAVTVGRGHHFPSMLLGPGVRDALRETDLISYDVARNHYVIVLPESTKKQAAQIITRITDIAGRAGIGSLHVGMAEFPADGLILEDLLSQAVGNSTGGGVGSVSPGEGKSARLGAASSASAASHH
ncbi:MAG: hypothetical protein M3Z21_09130 [Pseudomonadota bacterium]|nr:hypothetical protein [Pseudomonadota bacterium]